MSRVNKLVFDYDALAHNFLQVKKYAPNSKVIAMVKADAYGHGMVNVAKTLSDADAFGVASTEEALILRDARIKQSIILMGGFFHPDELPVISKKRLDVVIHNSTQLEYLEKTKLKKPITVWVKIDTGMHRIGFMPEKLNGIYDRLCNIPWVEDAPKLMTHFASPENPQSDATLKQINLFCDAVKDLPGEGSMANSAAIMAWPHSHTDWVRPGLMLYGISPFNSDSDIKPELIPVMSFCTELASIRRLKQGDPVGYGGTWLCPEDMDIGVVAVGYGDGYPRNARNGAPVLVNGVRVPLVGRVSMDFITVDLRNYPKAKVGDPVELWGKQLPIQEVAVGSDTIPYELTCRITARVQVRETS